VRKRKEKEKKKQGKNKKKQGKHKSLIQVIQLFI